MACAAAAQTTRPTPTSTARGPASVAPRSQAGVSRPPPHATGPRTPPPPGSRGPHCPGPAP
eukprot:5793542-Prorocentrum_lima.AAC.1